MNEFIATLIPGQLCNVESEPNRKPLMRVVTKIERRKKQGREWLYWHWVPGDPEPATAVAPRGMTDCGYSGVAI